MDRDFERELADLKVRFQNVIRGMDNRQIRDVLVYAAQPYIEAARRKAPRSKKAHYRYKTPKLIGKIRAPNGRGVRVATYKPGNLARSVKVLALRRLKRSVYVGPKVAKNGKGTFGSDARVDGFYAGFLEFGTKKQSSKGFLKESFASSKSAVIKRLKYGLDQMIKQQIKKQNLGRR